MFPESEQVFLDSIKPVTREFFPGKVGLDGGCGFWRSLYYAATYGAETIGLDLSEAIEAARENTRQFERVHLVQGDIFHPPIPPRSLDFVYSIGVLHTDRLDGLSVPLQNYYRREDIAAWYREAGAQRVQIDEDWNGRALGYAPAARP